ncbi:hypothetical protein CNO14_04660 (plasmid) [Borrelia miyamotoi]|uniref:Uncharacterized protein n=2 Tax=Borrelia miyamotoi TaxID=47466 RepID=A0AAQ3CME5_9SPIR|nr:hypothetical protein [Borrelia miyamotoi]AHH05589.1 Hypothetical protein BOM_1046 [Borrelia miyamotoi FR64b]ATQ15294.1 hypothetical protein CNO14_04660 [Borrelia miyamotoi]ATQ16476.1 hypothetical protein CNO13_04665 [Borrelia miyamotoi]ATQ17624.1 hypothetical protein CNO12_04670 [Borrelia miyamotoi]ATQ18926.1 hypothetical protein CNO11_05035 [Borrelia miyamotoi]
MAESKLKMPSGAVLVSVNIPKFKWCFTGTQIKDTASLDSSAPKDLIVKDLSLSITKPTKWKSIKECLFRVKTLSPSSKVSTDLDLIEGGIFYYHDSMSEKLSKSFDNNDEIEVLLFRTYCLGYSYSINSTKATETLKTTCGSISAIGKVPEQTVEFSGYSVKETVENKEELLETYIERSHFVTRDIVNKSDSDKYEIGRRVLPRNYEFFVVFVNQIQSEDQRTKFMVAEGQIATFSPSQDLSNQKIDLKCEVTLSKPLISLSYDYIENAKFFEI